MATSSASSLGPGTAIKFITSQLREAGREPLADAMLTLVGADEQALDTLAFVGKPAQRCWGTINAMDALFLDLEVRCGLMSCGVWRVVHRSRCGVQMWCW